MIVPNILLTALPGRQVILVDNGGHVKNFAAMDREISYFDIDPFFAGWSLANFPPMP